MSQPFQPHQALVDEIALALREGETAAPAEAAKYAETIVRYLQQQYGGDKIYIPQPYMRCKVEEILAARDAGKPVKAILCDFAISRRTYYRLLSQF